MQFDIDIKNKLIQRTEKFVCSWNNIYKQKVSEYIQEQISVLNSIRKNIELLKDKKCNGEANELDEFHTNNLRLLKSLYSTLKSRSEIKDFVDNIRAAIIDDINALEEKITDCYNTRSDYTDNGIGSSQLLRNIGDFFYHLCTIPGSIKIGLAKVLKVPFQPLKQRCHSIYYRDIVSGFLFEEYIIDATTNIFEIQKKIAKLAHDQFDLEGIIINKDYQFDNVDFESFSTDVISEELLKMDRFYSTYKPRFISLLEKSGTLELPYFYIRWRRKRKLKDITIKIDTAYRLWDSTFYALYEDWRFREELFIYISKIKELRFSVIDNCSAKLKKTINPVIAWKREYLEQLMEQVPDPDHMDNLSLKHFFTTELYKLQKEIRKQNIVEDFYKVQTEIEKILLKIEVDVKDYLKTMSDKSGVVRSPDYEKGIRKSDIYFFSPNEFIDYKCINPFLNKRNKIIKDFTEAFRKIIEEFSDFDQIIDFSLDTAILMLNANSKQEETVLMFKEGMKRSLNILQLITELNEDLVLSKGKELSDSFMGFIDNIKNLDNNDNILGIYTGLLKSKAIQESQDKRKKIFGFLLMSFNSFNSLISKQLKRIGSYKTTVQKKLKLDKAPVFVSSEISNYLAEINKRIFKLPIIYRYLFENAPVKEENLFLLRQKELDKIDNAYNDWKLGNYSSTLIVGETGEGKTSLIMHYIKTIKGSYKVYYLDVKRFYYSEYDFIVLMQDVFDNRNLQNEQEIIEYLNLAKGQQIIIIDGLERIFVRKPGGFECLHKLLSFIVSTNNHAFWLCSVSLFASSYLNKTISLKENFDYLVELNSLNPDEVRTIVLKRHRLSGYILQYKDDLDAAIDDKLSKDRQIMLEKEFFLELNKFAYSNISLSFCFWLESISEFTEKELFIKRFVSPDFDFLETLSSEKIYTLLLIILHGTITVDIHASICHQSVKRSLKVLSVLKEDSLLILKGEYYMLNGILFRHVVRLLKSRNLIH